MAPTYEDDTSRLPLITAWWQTFPTPDGIFARPDSALSLVEHRSRVAIHELDDPKSVLIGEKHDGGYRRLIAEKAAVLPMVEALSSGRLPYRFIIPSGDASAELSRAMQVETLTTDELRWGPELLQLDGDKTRRLRSLVDGMQVFVIVDDARRATEVYGGSRAELAKFGLLRYDVLDLLT